MSTKDFIPEYVYFDGNSTDGTIELVEYIRDKYKLNITLVKDQDPKDLEDDYVRVFNETIKRVKSNYVIFLHPDMICVNNPELDLMQLSSYVNMTSFAGEPNESLLEIKEGRTNKWKSIMCNGFGLHYYGHYGAANEDLYFSDITGSEHKVYQDVRSYPYEIDDSGIEIYHYSDVRPYERRLRRMISCLKNQNYTEQLAKQIAPSHPRVCLSDNNKWGNFKFKKTEVIPEVFHKYDKEFASVLGKDSLTMLPLKELSNV